MKSVLGCSRRPLTAAERRLIEAKARSLTAGGQRASAKSLRIAGSTILVLWLLTLVASDASWPIVTAFWLVVGSGITLWVRRDIRKDAVHLEEMAGRLESSLRGNLADVYEIRANSFVEFQEIEDEGACYAFELDGNRFVFITGQEFYAGARFPSLDFGLVYVLDQRGETVDMFIDKRGAKARPARTIPADVKRQLELPGHLEVIVARLSELESCLRPSSG
jgi:hypothetical protein